MRRIACDRSVKSLTTDQGVFVSHPQKTGITRKGYDAQRHYNPRLHRSEIVWHDGLMVTHGRDIH